MRSIYDNPLHLYPNPVHHGDAIHVNIAEEGKILKALLVNSVGKTISVDVISKDRNSIEFNTMGLSNGFYLIRIIHEDRVGNTIEFKSKFIVE